MPNAIQAQIDRLEQRLDDLERQNPVVVPLQTLAPDPVELVRPVHALVRQNEDDFTASFLDANVNASGDTEEEAITNLKDMLVATFEALDENATRLGPGPARQFSVLKQFIRRIA